MNDSRTSQELYFYQPIKIFILEQRLGATVTEMLTSKISKNEGGDDLDTFNSTNNTISSVFAKFGKYKKVNAIQELPKELLLHIYEFAGKTGSQTFVLGNVCKEFQNVFNTDNIWKPLLGELCKKSKDFVQKNHRFVFLQVWHKYHGEHDSLKKGQPLKIVMMGSGGVGKSALTIRFILGNWVQYYDPTIEDSYRKFHQVDQDVYNLEILDTAGPEEYSVMRGQYLRTGEAFVICFSMTDPSSFDDLGPLIENISCSKDLDQRNIPIVLAGCKSDLVSEYAISQDQIKSFSIKCGHPYILTSALNDVNVNQCFDLLIHEFLEKVSEEQLLDMMHGKIVFPPRGKSKNKCLVM